MYYCASQINGTVCYLAPEVLRGDDRHISTSADMWSLGAVITFIANDRQHLFRTERDVLSWSGNKSPIERTFKYPSLHNLVLSLLKFDKHTRPTADDVLQECAIMKERESE